MFYKLSITFLFVISFLFTNNHVQAQNWFEISYDKEQEEFIRSFTEEDLYKIALENGFEYRAAYIVSFHAPARGILTFYLKTESIKNFIETHPELIDHAIPPNGHSFAMSIDYHVITKIAKVNSYYLGDDTLKWVLEGSSEYGGGTWVERMIPSFHGHEASYENLIKTETINK